MFSIHWFRTGGTPAPYTSLITLSVDASRVVARLHSGVVALLADLIGRMRLQLEELVDQSC